MYKLFIFDFDGTLGDTKECVVGSFQQALKNNQLREAPREDIIHFMGLSLGEAFARLVQGGNQDLYDKLVADYRASYRELLPTKTAIFPGIKETLESIKDKDALCSIATSKKTEFAKLSCEYLGISQHFDLFIGDDQVENKKPHPEMLLRTLGTFSVDKSQAVMIGDSTFDIDMGNSIGMDTIAVTWGAHSEEELRSARPTRIINNPLELTELVG